MSAIFYGFGDQKLQFILLKLHLFLFFLTKICVFKCSFSFQKTLYLKVARERGSDEINSVD